MRVITVMTSLKIKDLHVSVEDKEILRGVDLEVKDGEIHALMGPNGNGKSTLLAAIMGHPKYTVTQGSIEYDGKDLLKMSVDERSRAGLFLAMQYPQEIPGRRQQRLSAGGDECPQRAAGFPVQVHQADGQGHQ
jgi:Fe-S cluster assembly ATP-binding protein